MSLVVHLRCVRCAKVSPVTTLGTCDCGGNLLVEYDLTRARSQFSRERLAADSEPSLWRYSALLPTERRWSERLSIGPSPLLVAPALGQRLGLRALSLKDDTRHPSASFKDRAGAIALAMAHERGEKRVAGASTGNAASSLACLAARTGMKTLIIVPKTAPEAKLAQMRLFGASVVTVNGTYDQAFDLCAEACRRFGWYNRNTGLNPFTREGKKTVSFELAEQLHWRVPDWVVVPVGDGNIISGVGKGFAELQALGVTDRVPRLLAAQAEGSDSITRAVQGDGVVRAVKGDTIADSISVSLPRDGDAAVRAIRESQGAAVAVPDQLILEAMGWLARDEGVFAEPAAATSIAALAQAVRQGTIGKNETVVALVTGNGLKDIVTALRAAKGLGSTFEVEPSLEALRPALDAAGFLS